MLISCSIQFLVLVIVTPRLQYKGCGNTIYGLLLLGLDFFVHLRLVVLSSTYVGRPQWHWPASGMVVYFYYMMFEPLLLTSTMPLSLWLRLLGMDARNLGNGRSKGL